MNAVHPDGAAAPVDPTPSAPTPALKRARSPRLMAGLATLATLGTAAIGTAQQATHAQAAVLPDAQRPNFVLVTMDDAARQDFRYMPYTRALIVDQGVELTNFVAPTPICVPSRTSTLTATYAHNHGNVTVGGSHGSAQYFAESGQNQDTLPVWLDDAGYETFVTGKWMNGYDGDVPVDHVEPGWDRWEPVALNTYNFYKAQFWIDGVYTAQSGYSSDRITEHSRQFIADQTPSGDPWFAWINYVAPHVGAPLQRDDPRVVHGSAVKLQTTAPAVKDRNTFANLRLRRQPNMWATGKGTVGSYKHPTDLQKQASLEVFQQRVESLQAIDRGVRDLVEELEATGQLDNTYIIVTSDNGFATGEHNLVNKLWHYRDIVGLPTAIRGPGISPGTRAPSLASVVDLGPTIATWAGASYPADSVDGTDLGAMLTSSATLRRAIPLEAYRMATETDEPLYSGVLYDRWTYVRVMEPLHEELYDNLADPFQMNNLAEQPEYTDALNMLRAMTLAYSDCAGNTCPKSYS